MPFTFRQISARGEQQGGASFTNLSVSEQMSLSHCMNVSTNPTVIDPTHMANVLFESTRRALLQNALLVDQMAISVRQFVEKELLDVDALGNVLIPSLEQTEVLKLKIVETLNALFAAFATPLIVCDDVFKNMVVQEMLPFGLLSNTVVDEVVNTVLSNLLFDTTFLQKVSTNFTNFLVANQLLFTTISNKQNNVAYTISITPEMLFNKTTLFLFEVLLEKQSTYSVSLQSTLFTCSVASSLQRITITAVYKDNLQVLKIFYNQLDTPAVTTKTISFTEDISNTTNTEFTVYVRVYVETLDGYVTCVPNFFVQKSFILDPPVKPKLFETPVNLYKTSTPIKIYDSERTLSFTNSLNYAKNGVVSFSLGAPVWYKTIPETTKLYACSINDEVYLACNAIGHISQDGKDAVYNGGVAALVAKLNYSGQVVWFVTLSTLGISAEDVYGITGDQAGNIYVYGTHTSGNKLYFYDSESNLYTFAIDSTPAINSGNGQAYGLNAILVKISADGFLSSYVNIAGYNNQSIVDIYIDPFFNTVYITAASQSNDFTVLRGFNSEVINVPSKGRYFVVSLQQQTDSDVKVYIIETVNNNDTIHSNRIATDENSNMYVFYNLNSAAVNVYDANSYTTPSLLNATATYMLIKYNKYGFYQSKIAINTTVPTRDTTCRVSTLDNGDITVCFPVFTSFTIEGVPVTIQLPAQEVGVNVIVKFLNSNNSVKHYAMMSNTILTNMYTSNNNIYVHFTFTDVVTVYVFYYPYLNFFQSVVKLTLGAVGNVGNGVIMFNNELTPRLLGYCLNT